MNRSKGMTLIELMVVVVIVAILAGIAYPSYRQYAIRTNRTEAKTALLEIVQRLEKCYTRYNAYDADECDEDGSRDTTHYTIRAQTLDAAAFLIRAAPKDAQINDAKCGTLAINNLGQQFERTDKSIVPANKCW